MTTENTDQVPPAKVEPTNRSKAFREDARKVRQALRALKQAADDADARTTTFRTLARHDADAEAALLAEGIDAEALDGLFKTLEKGLATLTPAAA